METWRQILHNASLDLMKLLVDTHETDLQDIVKEKEENQDKLASLCPINEKERFVNDVIEETRQSAKK